MTLNRRLSGVLSLVTAAACWLTFVQPASAVTEFPMKFTGSESVTAVSGYAGGYKTLTPGTDFFGLYGIQWWEKTDDPRQLTVHAHHINLFNTKKGTAKLNDGASGNAKFALVAGNSLNIYKVQVCTTDKNKATDNKLKGVRVWARSIEYKKKVVLKTESAAYEAKHTGCKKWHPAVACGDDKIAVGVRAHYATSNFFGIALICRKVVNQ